MAIVRPQIGSTSFLRLRGAVDPVQERLEIITRNRVDGVALRKTGKRPEPFMLLSLADVSSTGGAATALTGYKALCGTLQTVKDELGNSWSLCAVLSVRPVGEGTFAVANMIGGLNTTPAALLACEWELIATTV